nr:MAG TPA: hypothetical protein [Caudoviricetes sp.]
MFNLIVLFYLADVCDGIHFASNTVFVLLAVLFGVFLLALMVASDYYEYKQLKEKVLSWEKYIKIAVITGVVTGVISILTPSQKTMYMIAGGIMVNQTASEVINSNLYKKIYNAINDKLDYIERSEKTDKD